MFSVETTQIGMKILDSQSFDVYVRTGKIPIPIPIIVLSIKWTDPLTLQFFVLFSDFFVVNSSRYQFPLVSNVLYECAWKTPQIRRWK